MQFTLYYRGNLKSGNKATPRDKHELRRHFHRQMMALWQEIPLINFRGFLSDPPVPASINLLSRKNGFTFAPLVSEKLGLVAELEIQLLWPQAPGAIITSGGDIDNRLKTLFDALKLPSEPTALPKDSSPGVDETPFYCLLEDDSLITRVTVETDRLLDPVAGPSEVVLFIRVRTRQIQIKYGTFGLP
ncbi:MAG: hypothetical protein ACOH1Q_13045 [Thiobacillus sp.]